MNIIVDRPQLVRVVLLYLNKFFGDLTTKTSEEFTDSVFFVNSDNEILMEYLKDMNRVFIHYGKIWSKIEKLFSLKFRETQSIMKHWLEEHYNFRDITPTHNTAYDATGWDNITI